ncbi:sensory rhodopsin transducer [Paenibacillus gansuensis]|uniref:Sensory rhodopsin transducer n=1 Tax=Paenibacillus gansuensis TaxID=306542 RepID=A0ABW5PB26_9BACL
MHSSAGSTVWYIPDGYIPEDSSGKLASHESVCVLNSGSMDAMAEFTIFFEDRDPIDGIYVTVPGRRTRHIRTSSLTNGTETIPVGIPYAIQVTSSLPVIVQYSRLDSTQAENALMSTMAFPINQT